MSHTRKIENMVKAASESLGKSLSYYWPVVNPNKNSLQEANLTYHFSFQAVYAGLQVYPEASNGAIENGHSRVDLLVHGLIDNAPIILLVESKRLYSAEKARLMVNDYKKIRGFSLVLDGEDTISQTKSKRYGLLLALTTSAGYAEWWNAPEEYENSGSWGELRDILLQAKSRGFFTVLAKRPQNVLYAIYEIHAT